MDGNWAAHAAHAVDNLPSVGHARDVCKADFVLYLEQRGLQDALTRRVLLFLQVPYAEDNTGDLVEASRVSSAWRLAVAGLIHGSVVGRKCVADKRKHLAWAIIERVAPAFEKAMEHGEGAVEFGKGAFNFLSGLMQRDRRTALEGVNLMALEAEMMESGVGVGVNITTSCSKVVDGVMKDNKLSGLADAVHVPDRDDFNAVWKTIAAGFEKVFH